jgi:FMN reductase
MRRSLVVVSAGLGVPSSTRLLADRLAESTERVLGRLGSDVDTTVVELREHAHDLVNHQISGYPSTELKPVLDLVVRADGLIAVTPTYAGSFSGLFKSFVDVLDDDALADKPVLVGATGGTARHSLVLEHAIRPLFTYLRAVVVPTSVFAAPEDWAGAAAPDLLAGRIARAADQLATEIGRRDPPAVRDPFADPTPFDRLLDTG